MPTTENALPPNSKDAAAHGRRDVSTAHLIVLLTVAAYVAATFGLSWWRWWTYQYQTFDLAFYVQGLWLALRGQGHVPLLGVSILGNHAEPITFLALPIFALAPHPMTLAGLQIAALATMPFTALRIARHLGFSPLESAGMAALTLLTPLAGYIGVHEFHPEAFAAPLLLLLIEARLRQQLGRFWLWFALTVACKENVALMLAGWCVVHGWCDRRQGRQWQWRWNFLPLLFALAWLGLYFLWLSPWLNAGRVDYANLYAHLGSSPKDMALKLFTEPGRAAGAFWRGLTGGNLVWASLVSFALLPLLRPRWLLIAAPIALQHLLSFRSSEWTIYFHYAAPLAPLVWIAAAEAMRDRPWRKWAVAAAVATSLLLQVLIGTYRAIPPEWSAMPQRLWEREQRQPFVEALAADPSLNVTAGIPYLSHLAARRELHSLHFILKGTYTLSNARYTPDYRPDTVLIDYADAATFSTVAGFYHPAAPDFYGKPIASSDELLNQFLSPHPWKVEAAGPVSLLRRADAPSPAQPAPDGARTEVDPSAALLGLKLSQTRRGELEIQTSWEFTAPRARIPWMEMRFASAAGAWSVPLGLTAPEVWSGRGDDIRRVPLPPSMPSGEYQIFVVFQDRLKALWSRRPETAVLHTRSLGKQRIQQPD